MSCVPFDLLPFDLLPFDLREARRIRLLSRGQTIS